MRVIYRKVRHAHYLYIKRNVEKVWGARYLSKNTVVRLIYSLTEYKSKDEAVPPHSVSRGIALLLPNLGTRLR